HTVANHWWSGIHGWCISADLRVARRLDSLRETHWKQHGWRSSKVLGRDAFYLRLHHARSRQLGARRRLRGRICDGEIPGSATARAARSSDRRVAVPGSDWNRHRVLSSAWLAIPWTLADGSS